MALAPAISTPAIGTIEGLEDGELDLLQECLQSWSEHREKNRLRNAYYKGDQELSNLDIAVPDQLAAEIAPVVNWPKRVVHALSNRLAFEGYTYDDDASDEDEDLDPYDLAQVMDDTEFLLEVRQGIVSALKHGVSFMSVTEGDPANGDSAEVVPLIHSGDMSGAVWSRRRRRLDAFTAITDSDKIGLPREIIFFVGQNIYRIAKEGIGQPWRITSSHTHSLSRIPVEPLRFQPELDNPLGQSRINKAVRDITDRAVRTILRSEITSEIYSGPNIVVSGADEEAFKDANGNPIPAWKFSLSKMLEIPLNELDEAPQIKQLQQATMQPHHSMLRMQAEQMSSETNVPISDLGIVQDNPSSAQAIFANKESLVIEADDAIVVLKRALENLAYLMIEVRDGSRPDAGLIHAKFKNPATPSIVSSSDAMVKQISAIPWLADTDVALEELGYSQTQIRRLLSQKQRIQGEQRLNSLLERAAQRSQEDPEVDDGERQDDPTELQEDGDGDGG